MKSLTLLLCTALAVTAEVAVNTDSEHLRNLATLLQEHHRFARQATTPPSTEGAISSTAPPPNSTDVTSTTGPSTGFGQPACQRALETFIQDCLSAHGLSTDIIFQLTSDNSTNAPTLLDVLSRIYCRDERCLNAFLKYYETCIGNGVG